VASIRDRQRECVTMAVRRARGMTPRGRADLVKELKLTCAYPRYSPTGLIRRTFGVNSEGVLRNEHRTVDRGVPSSKRLANLRLANLIRIRAASERARKRRK
jgi:hypothetical protein